MIHTGNILEFESVALPDVGILRAVDLAGEHLERTYPQRTVIIQFAIHHHRQAGLGIRGEILHKIPVALEMTVDAAAEDATTGVRLREVGGTVSAGVRGLGYECPGCRRSGCGCPGCRHLGCLRLGRERPGCGHPGHDCADCRPCLASYTGGAVSVAHPSRFTVTFHTMNVDHRLRGRGESGWQRRLRRGIKTAEYQRSDGSERCTALSRSMVTLPYRAFRHSILRMRTHDSRDNWNFTPRRAINV